MIQQSMKIPPATGGGLYELINAIFSEKTRNIHTQIPARVTKVNYQENWVNVQPLVKNPDKKDIFTGNLTEYNYPEIYEVPIEILSANRGKARITMPVKVGDVGVIEFSERDTDNLLNTRGEEIQPSGNINTLGQEGKPYRMTFRGEWFTPSSAKNIDPNNIVIENENSVVTLKPSGEIVISFGGTSLTFNPSSGDVSHSSGSVMTGGGDFVTSEGYSLRTLYEKTFSHVHGGVTTGSGQTGDIA